MQDIHKQLDTLQQQVSALTQRLEEGRLNMERVVIMVDRSNLDQTWRRIEHNGFRPDYVKLTNFLAGARSLRQVRVYYSDLDPEMVQESERADWQNRQSFYSFLRHQGWLLRGVRKKIHGGVATEKGLDAALIRDMDKICRENRCDTIVLVAGDADYCEVVSDVQDNYCVKVEVAFFPQQTARDLQSRASKFINLECHKDLIVRKAS